MPQYTCSNEKRRIAVAESGTNGIDYMEVLDTPDIPKEERQRILHLYLMKPAHDLNVTNIFVIGGERIKDIVVTDVMRNKEINPNLLILKVNKPGDFSLYTLRIQTGPYRTQPPEDFDPSLSFVVFSFKVECPNDFDSIQQPSKPKTHLPNPTIDYLAKDYTSFRQLILDRMAIIMPEWKEKTPADLGIALVEILAYAGDYLSYYQDAVATEAYLGTARKRISVRRHARLLDYYMHEGNNARVWVCIEFKISKPTELDENTLFITRFNTPEGQLKGVKEKHLKEANDEGAQIFKPVHTVELRESRNKILFHTWGDNRCCLPIGTTNATLRGTNDDDDPNNLDLKEGDILIFQEVLGPESGRAADANPEHNHVVRLNANPKPMYDPLLDKEKNEKENEEKKKKDNLLEISWHPEDALPFSLCLWQFDDESAEKNTSASHASVARGNVVLADHGQPIEEEGLIFNTIYGKTSDHLVLTYRNITHQAPYDHETAVLLPASRATFQDSRKVLPDVRLEREDENWTAVNDLFSSDRFATELVTEIESDGKAYIRFGDNVQGRKPSERSVFKASYRIGGGSEGNIGSNAIAHVISGTAGIDKVFNPLPAKGGADPESINETLLYAPQKFHDQERAVTADDYAEVAQRHPSVQKAVATMRWTGSWYTVFITIDRKAGWPVDQSFKNDLRNFLERFRLAGHDVEIDSPRFVSLEISITVNVATGFLRTTVKKALMEKFSNQELSDGKTGIFHPDSFTFGQPVYLSELVRHAMKVHGVGSVNVDVFQRFGHPSRVALDEGRITFGRLEIARLDNDPNAPENGKIDFITKGGL